MDKRLSSKLSEARNYNKYARAANKNSSILLTQENGYLEPEEGERTYKLTQKSLKSHLPHYNTSLMFDLTLSYGPYSLDYTQNGSSILLGGSRGHLSIFNWREAKLVTEIQVKDSIKDVHFLHNELLFAVAQKKHVYIYDSQGIEIHCLKNHMEPQKLEFLPYHYLLCSVNHQGFLKYMDVSTGKPVAEHRFRFEHVFDMKANPWNSVVCVSDARGIVSMWTPNLNKPAVRLVTHNGPCRAIGIDMRGLHMVTAGSDCKMKVYDIRALGEPLFDYWTTAPASSIDISQNGLLGVSTKDTLLVWKDWNTSKQKTPYMEHVCSTAIYDSQFVPFEDFMGLTTQQGFSNVCIPGSGIANYDSKEANPFQSKKQRQEHEVHSLLDKLAPSTIVLNPHVINTIDPEPQQEEIKFTDKKKRKEAIIQQKRREEIAEKAKANTQIARELEFLEDLDLDLDSLPTKKHKGD